MPDQFIYLLRHAKAEERSVPRADVDRCLVEKGRQQALTVGRFMRRHQLLPDLVLTSPYPRALQTAVLVATAAEFTCAVEEALWLSHGQPQSEVADLFARLRAGWPASTLLVGHEPELSQLLASLLGTAPGSLHIKKSTLICLHYSALQGYRLQWCVPVRLLR